MKENYSLKNREMHIHHAGTVKVENDTVNDTLFLLIKQNSHITAKEISERLKISVSTVKRKIKKLKEQGRIRRIGSDKTEYWEIIGK